jgi:beta-lactamase class A
MLNRKVPLSLYLISVIVCLVGSFLAFQYFNKNNEFENTTTESGPQPVCNLNIARLKGFEFIKPILYAEPACESADFFPLKSELTELINQFKLSGDISSASIYVREFGQARWMVINENEKYSPGSLLKVPELIAFCKMNEIQPGFFEKSVTYKTKAETHRNITFKSKHIELGQSYTIRELIKYMIVYSDNDATMLLNEMMDRKVFNRVFTDLGLPEPDYTANDYPMTSAAYSSFLKELYNSSYLNTTHSEFCMNLMSQTDYTEGLVSGLPKGCIAVHKFGEGGFSNAPNFNESAIVYCNNKAYLLTVMSKGTNLLKMPNFVKAVSKLVYTKMTAII